LILFLLVSISINRVIADNLVNENFGDNMITLHPDEVKQRFAPLFAQKFLVMVDERAGTAEILTPGQAVREAEALGIEFLDQNNGKGRIGALGAVVWGNRGTEAAGLYGEHL
jgi:hypothetical protein